MRIALGKLRSLINELALKASDAKGLALMLRVNGDGSMRAILYEAKPMLDATHADMSTPSNLSKFIVGVIITSPGIAGEYSMIDHVAAKKGWGPFMYDIALSNSPNGLVPDRTTVSSAAQKVWLHYRDARSDVISEPKTDGMLHGVDELDRVYKMKGTGPNVAALEDEHERLDDETQGQVSMNVTSAASKFFASSIGH